MAIIMLQTIKDISPTTLPGENPDAHYLPKDIASFGDVLLASNQIEMECATGQNAAGWWPVGETSIYRSRLYFFQGNLSTLKLLEANV